MASKKPAKKAAAKKVAPRSDKSKAAETAAGAPPRKPPAKQDDLFVNPDSVQPVQLQDEMERSFLDYAMSVIMSRALPDVRESADMVVLRNSCQSISPRTLSR